MIDSRCPIQMGSIPVTRIRAHDAKIYGIDWSRSNGLEIVTCSLGASHLCSESTLPARGSLT